MSTGKSASYEELIGRRVFVRSDTGGVGYIAYIREIVDSPDEEGTIDITMTTRPPGSEQTPWLR